MLISIYVMRSGRCGWSMYVSHIEKICFCYKYFWSCPRVVNSDDRSYFPVMLLLDVTYFFSVSDIVFYGQHPKQLICTVCIIVVLEQEVYTLFTVHVKK